MPIGLEGYVSNAMRQKNKAASTTGISEIERLRYLTNYQIDFVMNEVRRIREHRNLARGARNQASSVSEVIRLVATPCLLQRRVDPYAGCFLSDRKKRILTPRENAAR
jgi:hypothetical protein